MGRLRGQGLGRATTACRGSWTLVAAWGLLMLWLTTLPLPAAAVVGYPYRCEFRDAYVPLEAGAGATGDLCADWDDNSKWSNATVRYRADHRQEERACQEIEILDPGTRCAEIRLRFPVSVKNGKHYTATISVRSDTEMLVLIAVGKGAPPWTRYLKGEVLAGPDWNEATLSGRSEVDDPESRVVMQFPKAGKVWIRSFSLAESDQAPPPAPTASMREGNLIPNGDFALGSYGWTSFGDPERNPALNLRETMMRYSVDPPACGVHLIDGKPVLSLALSPETFSLLFSPMVNVVPGGPFEARVSARRVGGSGPVQLGLFGLDWQGARISRQVGSEWVDVSLRGLFPLRGFLQVRTEILASGNGTLEIREVALEQRAPAPGSATPKAFGVVSQRSLPLYETGLPVLLNLRSANAMGERVSWRVVDSVEKEVRSGTWELTSGNADFAFTDLPVGWYQLRWDAPWAGTHGRGRLSLGVVPEAKRRAGSASPFGIHVEGSRLGVEKMRLLGVQWLRTNNPLFTKWTAVQPRKDVFLFPDEFVDRFCAAGFSILGNLDRTPQWASPNPSDVMIGTDFMDYKRDLPNDLAAWQVYVRNLVERYKGKINHWEIWNEPDIRFLRPPPGMTHAEAYAKLLETAAKAAKAVNPEAVIVGGPAYFFHKRGDYKECQEDFTERLVEDAAFGLLDVFGFHHYVHDRRLLDTSSLPADRLAWIRTAMAKHGKSPVVWNTEWGYSDFGNSAAAVVFPGSSLSIDDAAADFVYWSVAQLALGIEKIFWYDGQDNFYYAHHSTKAFFDYREPRPIAVACAILTKTLDGMVFSREDPLPGGRAVRFTSPGREVVVVWACKGGTVSYPVPDGTMAFDHLGRGLATEKGTASISAKPVYIVVKP